MGIYKNNPYSDRGYFLVRSIRESRSADKVQALFADPDERARAWKELETLEEVEIVGSLKYNIEVNAAG